MTGLGAYSMTCLNPWQGLGALRMGSGGKKIGKKMAQNAQNGSKSSFVGPEGSDSFKLCGKKFKLLCVKLHAACKITQFVKQHTAS